VTAIFDTLDCTLDPKASSLPKANFKRSGHSKIGLEVKATHKKESKNTY
jgi:hypothetical protein